MRIWFLVVAIIAVIVVSGCTNVVPECGNGLCEVGESYESCPGDCNQTGGQLCGNGVCESGETASNCPVDCGGGGLPDPGSWAGWLKYTDIHGFSLYRPQGWSVEVEDCGLIRVGENLTDGTGSAAFIWTIALNQQTTEEELFDEIVSGLREFIPELQVTGERYVPEYDAYVGTAEYGSYAGALILSIEGMNAHFAGLIAPKAQYNQSIDELIRVLYSFQYEPGLMDPDAVGIVQMGKWTDPIEGAFSLNVPKGWTVHSDEANRNTVNYLGSGINRPYADAGYVVNVYSPDQSTGVFCSNPYGYLYTVPTTVLELAGFTEGTLYDPSGGVFEPMLVWHYMNASDYITELMMPLLTGCTIGKVTNRPDLAAQYQGAPWISEVTAAELSFECSGTAETIVVLDTYYELAGVGMWAISLVEYWAPEGEMKLIEKIVNEMQESFQIDAAWAAEEQRQVAIRTGIISETGNDIANMIQSSYELRSNTLDETAHKFSNAILGVEDVYDPDTGEQWTVPSGSEHYWQDIYGDIWGTGTYTPPSYSEDFRELVCPYC